MKLLSTALSLLLSAMAASAQLQLGSGSALTFATPDEAKAVLASRDDFIKRLSPFDRAAKINSGAPVSEQDLEAVAANVRAWTEADIQKVTAAFEIDKPGIANLALPFPPTILLIKTSGDDEGAAPYTRGNAIVLPEPVLARPANAIARTLSHELFHILSRAHPELRDALYRIIGFHRCPEVLLPETLRDRRITNPDAPVIEHCIRVMHGGQPVWAAPVLYSRAAQFAPAAGGTFFRYLQFRLQPVAAPDAAGGSPPVVAREEDLMDPGSVSGFFDQIGHNTRYIIHPDEILADNFVLLIRKETGESPEILEKMGETLRTYRASAGPKRE
jgi:hypothetical protein